MTDKKTANRLARFGQQGQLPKHPQMAITRGAADGAIKISYGHDGLRTFVVFSGMTDHVAMTDDQVEEMITALRSSNDRLKQYRAEGGQPITQGSERPNG